MSTTFKYGTIQRSLYLSILFVFVFLNANATIYTLGTSGSQSATVTATSASPDKFYDNGGSAANYSASVSATFTFNCAVGKFVRLKSTSIVTEATNDLFKVYDGTTSSDRLIGETSFSGVDPGSFMYVSTTGSLTIVFSSNASVQKAGWSMDVYVDNYAGQLWDGSTSTEVSTATNWEGDVLPYNKFTSIYVPSSLTNYPVLSNSSSSMVIYDLKIQNGASFTFSSTITGHGLLVYGNLTVEGTFTQSGNYYVQCEGGNSTSYATLSGNGFSTMSIAIGDSRIAYYKLISSTTIYELYLTNFIGNSKFDMNDFNLTNYFTTIDASTTFYQRSGILSIEQTTAVIDDVSFNENTGTTYFSKGTTWTSGNQTIPSLTYFNLQVRTNNGYTATIGSGTTVTVSNDLILLNPGTAGGIVSNTTNDVTIGGNFTIGSTGNGLILNLSNRIYRSVGSGTFTMGNISTHAINVTYSSGTNYGISGFTSPTFYGTFTYNSSSSQKVIPATYFNIISTGSGTKTLYNTIDINGDLTLSGGILNQSTFDMTIAGNWINTGNYFNEGTGTVIFDGSGSSFISSTTSSIGGSTGTNLYAESFENAGLIPSGWAVTTVTTGATPPAITYVTTSSHPTGFAPTGGSYFVKFNSFSASSASQIRLKQTSSFSTANYTNVIVNFDWSKDNGYSTANDYVNVQYSTDGSTWNTVGTALYRYSATGNAWSNQSITLPVGAENQSTLFIAFLFTSVFGNDCHIDNINVTGDIAGTTYSGEAFNKFSINKTGTGSVTLASKTLIQTSLTFTAGILNSTVAFYPEFDEDATVNGTVSATSHVNGTVLKRTNTTTKFTAPIGSATKYRPFSITPSGTGATTWTLQYFGNQHPDPDVDASGLTHVSHQEYWNCNRSGASPVNAFLEMTWVSTSGVSDYTKLRIAHYDGTTDWDMIATTPIGTNSSGTLTSSSAVSTFSPFTIGTISGINVLPIGLLSFTGEKDGNSNLLNWVTETELNNDYFIVEKTTDGVNFETVGKLEGAGNSNQTLNYKLIDYHMAEALNYYRLIQTDFDGKSTATNLIMIDNRNSMKAKSIIHKTNLLGQEIDQDYKGLIIIVYSDGTSIKAMQ